MKSKQEILESIDKDPNLRGKTYIEFDELLNLLASKGEEDLYFKYLEATQTPSKYATYRGLGDYVTYYDFQLDISSDEATTIKNLL